MNINWNFLYGKQHMLIGASLIRIALGFIILYNYAIHYSQREFLWSAFGLMGAAESDTGRFLETFSIYSLNSSLVYFNVLYHVGIFIAVLFMIGFKGKILSFLNFIFVWSLMNENNIILDGGDNISRIVLLYLLFANTTAYYSVDKLIDKSKKMKTKKSLSSTFSLRNVIHNLAILSVLTQVALLYLTSGLHKAMGELWQNGTALYYVLQVDEFSHPFFRELIHSSDVILVLGAYFTIVIQLAFPFALFNRFTKYIAMTGIISMHLGIGIVMGLFSFSFIMIANQLLFLTDQEYFNMFQKFQNIKNKIISKSQKLFKTNRELESDGRLILFYDGWCPVCLKSVAGLEKLDSRERISFLSFREPENIMNYDLELSELELRMHTFDISKERTSKGIHSVLDVCKTIPMLWLLYVPIKLSTYLGLGQRIYDHIAKNRTVFPTGNCDENSCELIQKKVD